VVATTGGPTVRGYAVFGAFRRAWMPLLIVVVVALGACVVVGIRDTFGVNAAVRAAEGNADNTKPFNPKHITYEIPGSAGGRVNVDYLDENGQPHEVTNRLRAHF
jgi:hypothetical protein